MNGYILLGILLIITFSACSIHKEGSLQERMMSCIGKTMVIPSSSIYTSYVYDTVSLDLKGLDKIIMYIDSNGCVGCRMNLKGMKKFAAIVDSLTNGDLKTIIYIHPSKKRHASTPILQAKYHYPVSIDMRDDFGNANRELLSHGFNTFLVDEKDKVLLVGNPVENYAIGKLYLKTILNRRGYEYKDEVQDNITHTIDLGVFNWNESQTTLYTLQNTSKQTLVIDTVTTSCECTRVSVGKKILSIGDTTIVTISFDAEEPEQFVRDVIVRYDDKREDIIRIEGVATE